jgi:Sulfotransferase family
VPGTDSDRSSRPVFVIGCHRSGTNLLYDMLLSSGGFAIYRSHLAVFESLIPRFGSLENRGNRENLLRTWLQTKCFRCTGLDAETLSSRILNECRSGPDFIRIVMGTVAQSQGAPRWALYDPDNVLHIEKLKAGMPNALFLHIVRDGRDIALSLKKMGGFRPLPWRRSKIGSLVATGLYWEWMVRSGRKGGNRFPADYMEIRYEDLVTAPQEVLQKVGAFLAHDLDFSRIRSVGLGRLSESNSSFREENPEQKINPVGRWRQRLSRDEVGAIEAAIGGCLEETGYSLSLPEAERTPGVRDKARRAMYSSFLNTKNWLKLNTAAGRLVDLSALEIEDAASAETL